MKERKETLSNNQMMLIYEGISKLNKNEIQFNELYRKSLISIYTNLNTNESTEDRIKWANNIFISISKLEKSSPFDLLPSIEAQLFKDSSNISQSEEMNVKLTQLSQLFKARFQQIEEIENQSQWSFLIGIAGFITGIMSLIIPFIRRKTT